MSHDTLLTFGSTCETMSKTVKKMFYEDWRQLDLTQVSKPYHLVRKYGKLAISTNADIRMRQRAAMPAALSDFLISHKQLVAAGRKFVYLYILMTAVYISTKN